MKYSFKLFLVVIFCHIVSQSFSQYVPIPIEQKINNSQAIVEGRVIAKQSYTGEDGEIYTENILKVEKTLKGTMPTGAEVSVITAGGTLNGLTTVWSHLLSLNTNEYGVFFLTPTLRPVRQGAGSPAFEVYSGSQGFYHFQKSGLKYSAKATLDEYANIGRLYSMIGLPGGESSPFVGAHMETDGDSCITYLITPNYSEFVTEGAEVYFDLLVKANSGEYRLNEAELYLKYSTEWFYENMVTEGFLTYSQGVFDQNQYNLAITDYSSDVLHINLQAISSNYLNLEPIDTSFKLLATIGVEIKSLSEDPPIVQDFSVSDIANTYRTKGGYIRDFECVNLKTTLNCDMEITSITEIAAAGLGMDFSFGVDGVVEIQGNNFVDDDAVFGNCVPPNDHRVKFETIDGNWIAPLEGDYLEYTNTLIRVRMPTKGYKNNSSNLYSDDDLNDAVACTGKVRVCKDRGLIGCFCKVDGEIYVPFAARNTMQTNIDGCKESVPIILRDLDGDGGYTIRFFDNFKNKAGAVAAFKRALTTWRCATRVNFKVDEINPPTGTPGFCSVRFSSLPVGTLGSTSLTIDDCGTEPNIEYSASLGFSMKFNSDIDWHTGTNMPPLNWNNPNNGPLQNDLESIALHELGHAHLLLHTCNSPNVMVRPGPLDYRRELTGDDESGGFIMSIHSNEAVAPLCDGGNMVLINPNDCSLTPTVEIAGKTRLLQVFPNPAGDKAFIDFSDGDAPLIGDIQIFDSRGTLHTTSKILKGKTIVLDISAFPSGVYFVRYSSEEFGQSLFGKIIKSK
ncbi:MAG TPA: T9SS type A sorting domain-containing protein [Bacteroidetes bacterium]|nr:T9SS type A sorting domain-containing protein [Bacteroidota bacterium]